MDSCRGEFHVYATTCHAETPMRSRVPQPGLSQIPVGFALSLSISNCTRLLLNIRRAYYIGPRGVNVYLHDNTENPEDSTTPIVEWAPSEDPYKPEDGRVDTAESLLFNRDADSPASRESGEVKAGSQDAHTQRERWQYELRTMKASK